ncbi:peptide ABC transporter permease [Gordonia sp. 852002-50816_SCH5313054-c]|uniref:ABC transporter permease n=1 Tax=unclassified Gordonia (in: high G+C Gram-positive bacteria) TaxID=2657482 RepID=UPI0007E92A95|nr:MULTISPECIES: ABC transporter permease [unclassified Gordonia (in: high G+C Gram-positive bacteria)]OBC17996.1 peptide ABC transporter permease [Gordonia sp. 852002-50816_SCH5313054-a]OBC19455.1 peptide ABC transporter permease [Gordonia sp. 852002-50816_SCH5313054-c]
MTTEMPVATPRPERSLRAWATQSGALTWRQVSVMVGDKGMLVQLVVVPVLTLLMFKVVLGDALGGATGQDSSYSTVPLVILVSAMFGSVAAGVRLNSERDTGLLTRLYVLPIHRAADLTSRLGSEVVRIVVVTALLLAIGTATGFRITGGAASVIGIIAVTLMFGIAYATLVLALAVSAGPAAPLVPLLSLISSVLMFFNSGFSPIDAYPGWLQPIVANQPMTPTIEVMRSLADGGPVAHNFVKVAIWSVAIIAVCLIPALRGYRRAATAH